MEKAMRPSSSSSIFISSSQLSIAIVIVMLLFVVILILIACKFKPWRRFLSPSTTRRRSLASIKVDDIERPLVSGDLGSVESEINESTLNNSTEWAGHQSQEGFSSTDSIAVAHKQRIQSAPPQLTHSDSFILDIPNTSEDSLFGQTLKRPAAANQFAEERIYEKREDVNFSPKYGADKDTCRGFIPSYSENRRNSLMLEVISGPSRGLQYSIQSTNTSKLPVSIGRVSPGDIILKDSEVSGKHAMINWNVNKLKWELVDMGSLNGTILNSQAVHLPQSGSRHWSNPVELSSGDIITLGTNSRILVHITAQAECKIPFGIGIVSDPMALRRGGKKLPMEDVCYYQWPLPGMDQFGLFGICDGHGGADAATSVSKIMPDVIAGILADSFKRGKVLSQCDASDVLREAFYLTEARINHYYEGCTATVLLVWNDGHENFYAQCANVGDSACVINIGGKQIKMTEDHRITSYSERLRIQALGTPLRDGETRICGINLARMLGDKFLKEQDNRFSAEPYISEVAYIDQSSKAFALLASDGFWDVINIKKAVQLVHQTMERNTTDTESPAEKVANSLLSEARTLRTKDNTSIIFLDFMSRRIY
ncbi:Serine/threonine protein phosphatase [Handroanthus impetiginosus]|uniref:protein-serine/threonine phosphatase n=1 Tax=Handroanthus impetiginosus TaxID=429701 RepID=A0A2G9GHH5_9LAMI|nr:Serine/threonine protein phosphatase [Handroanthus impetiginosus]